MTEEYNNAQQVALYRQTRDVALRNEIVLRNMGLVRAVALSMRNMYIKSGDVEDVINEGVIALMDAIENFSPDKGAKFETYAGIKIRGAIIDFLRRQDWIPRNVRKFARALDKANSMLYNLYGRAPTNAELAEKMGMDEEKLLKLMAESSCTITLSFEELLYEDNIDEPSTKNSGVDRELMQNELRRVVAEAVESLSEREKQVVTLYYYKNFKYSDIAKALGVSEGRVCQIHSKAALSLKARLSAYVKGE